MVPNYSEYLASPSICTKTKVLSHYCIYFCRNQRRPQEKTGKTSHVSRYPKQNHNNVVHKVGIFPHKVSQMEDLRSKSFNHNESSMQIESYKYDRDKQSTTPTPNGIKDLRCYSASYATSSSVNELQRMQTEVKFKKGKSTNGSTFRSWSFNDPEMRRKRRVASYEVYTVEGKMKGSLKKSVRWFKHRCTQLINGWS